MTLRAGLTLTLLAALTKTPKLEMAKKIVPEWVGLDAEVGKLEEELEDKE